MTVCLHDDECTFVELTECPWALNAAFENHTLDIFGHYRNQMAYIPIFEWPVWLKEAIAHLSSITAMDEEAERHKGQAGIR